MDIERISEHLRFEWGAEGGFLYGLRFGRFEATSADRFLNVLSSIDKDDPSRFDPRIVGRIWPIPYYMLSHITNSRNLGLDVLNGEEVLRKVNDILAGFFGGSGG